MVTKFKKITVKSFLNTRLPLKYDNEIVMEDAGKIGPFYPIYIQATYNRKSTQFKSCLSSEYINNIEELTVQQKSQLDEQIRIIESIIAYEANVLNNANPLSVLTSKYDHYQTDIIEKVRDYIMNKYYEVLLKTRSEYMRLLNSVIYHKIPFTTFLKATTTLIPEFENFIDNETRKLFNAYEYVNNLLPKTGIFGTDKFFALIDWYDGSIQDWMINKIKTNNRLLPANHDEYISIIDRIIRE